MGDGIVVYTAVFGSYDQVRAPTVDCDWHVFKGEDADPRRRARFYKAAAHRAFPHADVTIWLDGNVQLLVDPQVLVDEWLGDALIAAPKHPSRDCVYDEAEACIKKHKGDPKVLRAQVASYRKQGYPAHAGLAETKVVIRRNTTATQLMGEMWWSQVWYSSVRDQVSFPWACWRAGVEWRAVDTWVPKDKRFSYQEHG
jgi:hypothetical protein